MYLKLESLRGVAACAVLLHHSNFSIGTAALPAFAHAWLFVDFFFMLSGFVMAHAYDDRLARGLPFGAFFALRLARLYPLHAFMLLAWVPFVLFKQYLWLRGVGDSEPFAENDLATFVANVLMLHSTGVTQSLSWNFPSWSISAELLTYALFHQLVARSAAARRALPALALAVIVYALIVASGVDSLSITYAGGVVRCVAGFAVGVWLRRLAGTPAPRPATDAADAASTDAARRDTLREIAAVLLVIGCVWHADDLPGELVAAASFALCIRTFAQPRDGLLGRALRTRVPLRLGELSYSIYLVHVIVLGALTNVIEYGLGIDPTEGQGMLAPLVNAAMLAIVVWLSILTHRWIEMPFMRAARARLAPGRAQASATPARAEPSDS